MLLAMGALLTTACDNEDNAAADSAVPTVGGQPIQFTATLAPKSGDGGAQTRAITIGEETGSGKEILNVAWKKGEEIAVYYQKTDDTYATTTATVLNVDSETGEATISATFDADAKNKGMANFVFPASLHNGSGDIDESQLLNNQNGLLRTGNKNISSISKNFDAATATGTIAVSGSKATISGTVAMQNRVCILKMALGFDDGQSHTSIAPLQGGNTLTIFVEDGPTYTITSAFEEQGATSTGGSTATRPFQQGDVIYVAMLPVASKTVFFSSIASGGIYRKFSTGVTLQDGKFYRNVDVLLSTSTLMPEGYKDLSSGSITAVDGDRIFQSNSAATANTITIADGATVTLNGVNISTTGPGIICNDDATIILKGTNSVTSTDNTAVQIGLGPTTLTISGSGSLTATGGRGAGSGSLTATGGGGAGIGSSREKGERGNIVINGGTVTAIGGVGAAGIGSIDGDDDVGYSYSCGDIIINGGTVTAFGGENGAGIGGGGRMSCGNIFINGGTVTATGGSYCAGIGSGRNATCGDITITDGVTRVTANKGTDAPYSIGRAIEGNQHSTGTITIGGTVYYDYNVRAFQNGGDAYLATSPLVYTPSAP